MKLKILKNFNLQKYNRYQINTRCKYFCQVKNIEELKEAINFAKRKKTKIFILGDGTNILLPDKPLNYFFIKIKIDYIKKHKNNILEIGAGTSIKKILNYCIKNNLSNLEWAGGLPGTLGGAIKGNAGAFQGEIKDNLIKVISLNINNFQIIERKNKECFFDYRKSIFKRKTNEVIISGFLKFKKGKKEQIKKAIREKIKYRKIKTPYNYPCAGSVFKNIEIKKVKKKYLNLFKDKIKYDPKPLIPAALIIDKLNLKGKQKNGAIISLKHPNFILNFNKKAKSRDIKYLINLIKKRACKKFKIKMEEEIIIL